MSFVRPLAYTVLTFIVIYFAIYSPEIIKGNHDFRAARKFTYLTIATSLLVYIALKQSKKD